MRKQSVQRILIITLYMVLQVSSYCVIFRHCIIFSVTAVAHILCYNIVDSIYYNLQVYILVEGAYQLEVTVFGYNNPTGRCQGCPRRSGTRACCDDFDSISCSGSDHCDSRFTYCLQTLGSTDSDCSYFGTRTSTINVADGPLNFSQNRVLGLENPLILQGLTNTYMVWY